MIDLLGFLLTWIKEAATIYKDHKSEQPQKKFILTLITLQNELTYMIARGEKIIALIAQYVERFDASSSTDKRFIQYRDEIRTLLVAQSISIEKIRGLLFEIWPSLRAIDFSLAKKLEDSLSLKLDKLKWLKDFLSNDRYPTSLPTRPTTDNTVLLTEHTVATYHQLQHYLEHDSPKQRILLLKENAIEISNFLSENFEVEKLVLISMENAKNDIA